MMREPPWRRNPDLGKVTLPLLVGIANAIESESARRYQALARAMRQRGETATAEAFAAMLQEENGHIEAIGRWAQALGQTVPDAADYTWRLPAEFGQSWDEVAGSARLTPYRAFAIAVLNEQRAFALYSYLAAHADDPVVAAQAERLALDELRHAALMRRRRRQAWHAERRDLRAAPARITSEDDLKQLLDHAGADIARRHHALAEQLRALGDDESAALLAPHADSAARRKTPAAAGAAAAIPLLAAAQAPLEDLSAVLEANLVARDEPLVAMVERALSNVVARIARIGLQIERRSSM